MYLSWSVGCIKFYKYQLSAGINLELLAKRKWKASPFQWHPDSFVMFQYLVKSCKGDIRFFLPDSDSQGHKFIPIKATQHILRCIHKGVGNSNIRSKEPSFCWPVPRQAHSLCREVISTFQLQSSSETATWAILTRQYNVRQCVPLGWCIQGGCCMWLGIAHCALWYQFRCGQGRHTTRHHWSGSSSVADQEQAGVQGGDQRRHDDRSQKSILGHRLGTGYQQQQGELWQEPPSSSSYKGWCTLWNTLQSHGNVIHTDKTDGYKWHAECCSILRLWKVTKKHLQLMQWLIDFFFFQQQNFFPQGNSHRKSKNLTG